ncbi:MAG: efflux RND transporter periplasmic adaptor subunit [Gammaproteobacteria bacterium]
MTASPKSSPAGDNAQLVQWRRLQKRRLWLLALAVLIVVVAVAWSLYYFLDARWYESTDDAYVNGNVVQITPRIPGTVVSIGAVDNDFVRQGQILVELDPSNADVALAAAEAALAQAVRRVRGLYSMEHTSDAEVAVQAAIAAQARADYVRRTGLAASGAISAEELAHARDAWVTAESTLTASRAKLAAANAQVANTEIATHPDVKAAEAKLHAAWLDDEHTRLVAPVSGYIAKRTVQVGQRVEPGTPLMAVVPLAGDQLWVDANFKETQLRDMRIGQPVTLTSDLYGGSVVYHGHVMGLGIGTGSAFSLLPAQNASGNWIKIVQRLPVRILIDSKELQAHPLRIGLSMDAKVNLRNQSGPRLALTPPVHPVFSTDVYAQDQARIDAVIARIIRANSGAPGQRALGAARSPR